jgi:hypothetical protein
MFTFLDFDDVPWNNNNAEHAVKAFATLRRVIDGSTTEKGLCDYLILLSLCETCKYKNVDFLQFLRSGSKDIDDLYISRRQPEPLRMSDAQAPETVMRCPIRIVAGQRGQGTLTANCAATKPGMTGQASCW